MRAEENTTTRPSGTPPNTSIVLTENELQYIQERHKGKKSSAIHLALQKLMLADDWHQSDTEKE